MAVAEDYVKFCTSYVMEHNADDLAFFEKQIEPVRKWCGRVKGRVCWID